MIDSVTLEDGSKIHRYTCDGSHIHPPTHYFMSSRKGYLEPHHNSGWRVLRGTHDVATVQCPTCVGVKLAQQFQEAKEAEKKQDRESEINNIILSCTDTRSFSNTSDRLYLARCWHKPSGTRAFMEGPQGEGPSSVIAECQKRLIADVRASDWFAKQSFVTSVAPKLLEF